MKKYILIFLTILFLGNTLFAGNHGPCKIEKIQESNSNLKNMIVTLECEGTNLPTTCTNLNKKAVTFDFTTEKGKARVNLFMTAFASNRNVQVSTYATCPSDIPSIPLIYGITLLK